MLYPVELRVQSRQRRPACGGMILPDPQRSRKSPPAYFLRRESPTAHKPPVERNDPAPVPEGEYPNRGQTSPWSKMTGRLAFVQVYLARSGGERRLNRCGTDPTKASHFFSKRRNAAPGAPATVFAGSVPDCRLQQGLCCREKRASKSTQGVHFHKRTKPMGPAMFPRAGAMRLLDHTLPGIDANLALDEALVREAEEAALPPVLRLWEAQDVAVVLGASGRLARTCIPTRATRIAWRSPGGPAVGEPSWSVPARSMWPSFCLRASRPG